MANHCRTKPCVRLGAQHILDRQETRRCDCSQQLYLCCAFSRQKNLHLPNYHLLLSPVFRTPESLSGGKRSKMATPDLQILARIQETFTDASRLKKDHEEGTTIYWIPPDVFVVRDDFMAPIHNT